MNINRSRKIKTLAMAVAALTQIGSADAAVTVQPVTTTTPGGTPTTVYTAPTTTTVAPKTTTTTTTTTVAPKTTTTTTTTTVAPKTTTTTTTATTTTTGTLVPITAAQLCSQMGVNVAGLNYWDTDAPFVDLMKMSKGWERPWGSATVTTPLLVNPQGYPLDISPSDYLVDIVHNDSWGRAVSEGRYLLSWDGQGTVKPMWGTKVVSSASNQVVFDVTVTGRLIIQMTATSATNPVRNVKLVPVAADGTPLLTGEFRPQFLNVLKNMRVLRMMDWNKTNNSQIKEWNERATLGEHSQGASKGVSYEEMINLANATGKDLWVNIPHLASNDYVTQMARLFSTKLNPDRTVYVEYTNEAWNGLFKQTAYFNSVGAAAVPKLAGYQAYTDRALQVFDIFKNNFARKQNVKVVLAGQISNPWTTQQILAYKDAGHKVDGFAIGYYVGYDIVTPANYNWLLTATPADVINKLKNESIPKARTDLEKTALAVKSYGIPLMAYETGQHLAAIGVDPTGIPLQSNDKITALLTGANRSSGMGEVYASLLYEWQRVGGGLYLPFLTTQNYSKYGSWGLKERGDQLLANAPKLKSIYQYCGWPQTAQ